MCLVCYMNIQINSPEQKLSQEVQKWKRAQDWGIEGSWTHLFPQTQEIYSYIWKISLCKGLWKLAEQHLHSIGEKGHTETGRRDRDQGLQETPPQAQQTHN